MRQCRPEKTEYQSLPLTLLSLFPVFFPPHYMYVCMSVPTFLPHNFPQRNSGQHGDAATHPPICANTMHDKLPRRTESLRHDAMRCDAKNAMIIPPSTISIQWAGAWIPPSNPSFPKTVYIRSKLLSIRSAKLDQVRSSSALLLSLGIEPRSGSGEERLGPETDAELWSLHYSPPPPFMVNLSAEERRGKKTQSWCLKA